MPLRDLLASSIAQDVRVELVVEEHTPEVITLHTLLEVGLAVDASVQLSQDVLRLHYFLVGVAGLHVVRETCQFLLNRLV